MGGAGGGGVVKLDVSISEERWTEASDLIVARLARGMIVQEAKALGAPPAEALRIDGAVSAGVEILILRGGVGPGEALPEFVTPEESAEADRLSRELTGRILGLKTPKEEP